MTHIRRGKPLYVSHGRARNDARLYNSPYNARLDPAAVTSSQSAITRPRKLLSGPAAKAGRFLFERELKTYELTVLPSFAGLTVSLIDNSSIRNF